MSINDTGADCAACGNYHCQYLCAKCVFQLLLEVGVPEDKALTLLGERWVSLENWEIEEVKKSSTKS
jgi:hypothetical protein